MHPADFKFLEIFPNGLNDEEFIRLGKKHKADKLSAQFNEELSKENLKKLLDKKDYDTICQIALKLLRKASMVSVFEKIAFFNYLEHDEIRKDFSLALYDFMHNFNKENFEKFTLLLARYKSEKQSNCAKWTIVTVFTAYFDPEKYLFIKPTTIKAISNALKVDICYSAYPTFETYQKAYKMIADYRKQSDICNGLNMMLTEAVLYCSVTL